MKSQIVSLNEIQIEYYIKGSGSENIICLHGHGRPVSDFFFLENENHRLVLIVLPVHGKSYIPNERIEKNPLTIVEFNQLIEKILLVESITQFHFVAFSQGGRFVLSLIPFQEAKIKSVHLISPDAMDNNSFYNKASRNKWARKLFESWEDQPHKFINAARIAKKLGLVRPKVFAFIQKFAANKESFQRASKTWRGFRNITTNLPALKNSISQKKFRFIIIMGKYDQVIRPTQAKVFLKKINQTNSLKEIECGHDFFKEENIPLLRKHFKIEKAPE